MNKIIQDIKPLKAAVGKALGEGSVVGCEVTYDEIKDDGVKALMKKHFNMVAIGNEFKADCLLGYSNGQCPETEEVIINGEKLIVPKMHFGPAEAVLDVIYEWNHDHPDEYIKVMGHVMVWHSQTPEYFFHEDYDKNKAYISKTEMNLRLEWFIKTVFEHFTGENSKYRGMFYCWDVVNEAVNDAGEYRKDTECETEPLSKVVDEIMFTEWDIQSCTDFDGSEENRIDEYERVGARYYNLYNAMKELKEEGQNIIGFIIWGNIDKNSWLQTATYIGGGSTSQRKHFPMLFDDNYQAKPAYWAFVNPCIEQNIFGN